MMPVFLPAGSVSLCGFLTQTGTSDPTFEVAYSGFGPVVPEFAYDDMGGYIGTIPGKLFDSMASYSGPGPDGTNNVMYGITNVVGPNAGFFRVTTATLDGTPVDGKLNRHYIHLVFFGVTDV